MGTQNAREVLLGAIEVSHGVRTSDPDRLLNDLLELTVDDAHHFCRKFEVIVDET